MIALARKGPVQTAFLSLVSLLMASASCFAEMRIASVSKERAKDLGVEVRISGSAPKHVWVELEFTPKGDLQDFSHVSLEIRENDKLLVGYAPLREQRSLSGSLKFTFMASRTYLDRVILRICVGQPGNLAGYDLRLKDFIAPRTAE